ncbi:MAG: GIY-YIG nuclease family protein [Smithella sp.]|jgi:putative endonuclease|nr:GIY-YIG nuclease family protein [Smithella sp.]
MPDEIAKLALMMYYVYILQSERDKEFYVGQTSDLKRRYSEHQAGRVESTRNRVPLKLLCYEAYNTKEEAARREEYLKTSDGRKDIRKRVIESLMK